jgi:putative spermidine/putrescine transport system substrate-binding protein
MTAKLATQTSATPRVDRRRFLEGAAWGTAGLVTLGAMPRATRAADEPTKPEELIVRAWGGNWVDSLEKGVSQPFTEATGIKISYDTTYHEEMKPKIWQAIAQNRVPPVHVDWDISATAIESALRGVCTDLSDLANLSSMKPLALPQGVSGVPYVAVYLYVYALAYMESEFPDGPPKSWNAMLEPRFKGRVAILDTGDGIIQACPLAAGGTAADIPGNMAQGWEWLRELKANEPLLGKDPDFTKWFQQEEVVIGCTIPTNVVPLRRSGVKVAWTVPEEGAYVATDCMWVPINLPDNETYWAKQYVNFALSEQAQRVWCDALGLPGTREGFMAPPEFVGDPAYPVEPGDFKRLIQVPDLVKSQNWNDWQLRFKEIMNV